MDGMLEASTGALTLLAVFLIVPGLVAGLTEELRQPKKVGGLEMGRLARLPKNTRLGECKSTTK